MSQPTVQNLRDIGFSDLPDDWTPKGNVVTALVKVMDELPGIGKDSQSPQGYAYRGIEQVTKEAQRLFAKHGVVIAPYKVKWYPPREIQVNNKPWTDERCRVTYRVYGPGGALDFIEVTTVGIGRDNSDKGSNKALTQAYKYALLETLMIADAKDDREDSPAAEKQPPEGWGSWEECDTAHDQLRNDVKAQDPDVRRKWNGYKRDSGYVAPFTKPQLDELDAQLSIIASEDAHRVVPSAQGITGGDTAAAVIAPAAPESTSMVSGENPEPPVSVAHETLVDDTEAGDAQFPSQGELSPASGVDPADWLNSQTQDGLDAFNEWRALHKVPAQFGKWTPRHRQAFDLWVAAR